MTSKETFEDCFNLLCGEMIGDGIHRDVFECRIDPTLVVKVENDGDWRYFANVHEMKFWNDHEDSPKIARWLAPCKWLSPEGKVLLQRRVQPIRDSDELPAKLPAFLNDVKRENYGWLDGKLVCFDYAMWKATPSLIPKKADWGKAPGAGQDSSKD